MSRVLRSAAAAATGDDEVNDPDLREEIELVSVLVAAAQRRAEHLSLREIDRLLGVPRAATT
ncbi:hypothetical protein [Luteipulveratus mongoliensis]|uniref:hypothetical protein n=1 Tax=Luteipulveratus mongoliensis TaxID=571913 RepID=UPI0012EDCAF8|nr:hypothetical protein [Luteipulveratus mongoliensis]